MSAEPVDSLIQDFRKKAETGFFSCFIENEIDSQGSVKYFQGKTCVNCTIMGPQILVKKSEESGRQN